MAGSYPDPPAPRMPYDRDGSIGFRRLGFNPINSYGANSATIRIMNNESNDTVGLSDGSGAPVYIGVVFPDARNVSGIYVNYNDPGSMTVQYSTNTTNGMDGSWATASGVSVQNNSVDTSYRSAVGSVSLSGVRGIRVQRGNGYGGSNALRALHVYGRPDIESQPDRLRMWHPTLDEPLDDNTSADGAFLDWGNVPRGTTQDRQVRIKNNSVGLTANNVTISTQVLSNTSPTLESQVTYSDGGAFAGSINIASIAPGSTSPIITIRRTTPLNATLYTWSMRTVVEPGSWS